jgi:hypothetical protein
MSPESAGNPPGFNEPIYLIYFARQTHMGEYLTPLSVFSIAEHK